MRPSNDRSVAGFNTFDSLIEPDAEATGDFLVEHIDCENPLAPPPAKPYVIAFSESKF